MTGVRQTCGSVAWQPWSARTFARARRERRRVLLSLGAAWSEGSRVMFDEVYADARVVAQGADAAHYVLATSAIGDRALRCGTLCGFL